MSMASAFLPSQSTNRGLPPSQKIQHLGAAVRGSPPVERAESPLHRQRPRNNERMGPRPSHPLPVIGPWPGSPGPAVDNTAANSEVAAGFLKTATPPRPPL